MTAASPDSRFSVETAAGREPQGTSVESDSQLPIENPKPPEIPDISVLEDRMPPWFRSTKAFAGLVTLLLVFFAFLSYRPLWHTDLWGHLAYGRLIWESGFEVLKGHEPLMALSQGIPFVDTAWLSQVLAYACYQALGVTALQFLFALSVTLCLGLLAWRFYRRSQNVTVTLVGLGTFLIVGWQQIFVNSPSFIVPSGLIRPQLAGWVCFIAVFVCLTSRRWRNLYWGLIPILFALWANLHGSFFAGLLLLACFLVGRAIDVERHSGNWRSIFKDRYTQRYFLLLELAAVAVLLNPYGLQIYSAALEISSHPNMQGLLEWEPLTLRSNQGASMAFASAVLMFLYRWSPRRVQSVEVLLLLGFGGLTLYYSRFMAWWAPVAAYYFVLHGSAVLKEDRKKLPASEPPVRTSLYTVVWMGMAFICFAITPFGAKVMHNREAEFSQAVGPRTPLRAVDYLNERAKANTLPGGLILNSYELGDYLLYHGPPNAQVFIASHAQFIPETLWRQYREIVNVFAGYQELLDVHGINVIVLSKFQHQEAQEQLQRDPVWRTDYEDDRVLVLIRRSPI